MSFRIHLTTKEVANVVLSFDPAVEAWSEVERLEHRFKGDVPESGIPEGATIFSIRSLGWGERREARKRYASGLYSKRGLDLYNGEVNHILDRVEGDYRLSLSVDDRRELERFTLLMNERAEQICRLAVTEVLQDGKSYSIQEFLDGVPDDVSIPAISELSAHIERISALGDSEGKASPSPSGGGIKRPRTGGNVRRVKRG